MKKSLVERQRMLEKKGKVQTHEDPRIKYSIQTIESAEANMGKICQNLAKDMKSCADAAESGMLFATALSGYSSYLKSNHNDWSVLADWLYKSAELQIGIEDLKLRLVILHSDYVIDSVRKNTLITNEVYDPWMELIQEELQTAKNAKETYDKVRVAYDASYNLLRSLRMKHAKPPNIKKAQIDCERLHEALKSVEEKTQRTFNMVLHQTKFELTEKLLSYFAGLQIYHERGLALVNQFLPDLREFTEQQRTEYEEFQRRMTMKTRVFGEHLEEVLARDQRAIPLVVSKALDFLKPYVAEIGLFRLNGKKEEIDTFKQIFDEGNSVDFSTQIDPHTVAALLKLYFRELPEPLLTFQLYNDFISIVDNNRTHSIAQLIEVVDRLPQANKNLLSRLVQFLHRVTLYSETNKMDAANLATVFGPNLLYSSNAREGAERINLSNKVVELLITEYPQVFIEGENASGSSPSINSHNDNSITEEELDIDSILNKYHSPNEEIDYYDGFEDEEGLDSYALERKRSGSGNTPLPPARLTAESPTKSVGGSPSGSPTRSRGSSGSRSYGISTPSENNSSLEAKIETSPNNNVKVPSPRLPRPPPIQEVVIPMTTEDAKIQYREQRSYSLKEMSPPKAVEDSDIFSSSASNSPSATRHGSPKLSERNGNNSSNTEGTTGTTNPRGVFSEKNTPTPSLGSMLRTWSVRRIKKPTEIISPTELRKMQEKQDKERKEKEERAKRDKREKERKEKVKKEKKKDKKDKKEKKEEKGKKRWYTSLRMSKKSLTEESDGTSNNTVDNNNNNNVGATDNNSNHVNNNPSNSIETNNTNKQPDDSITKPDSNTSEPATIQQSDKPPRPPRRLAPQLHNSPNNETSDTDRDFQPARKTPSFHTLPTKLTTPSSEANEIVEDDDDLSDDGERRRPLANVPIKTRPPPPTTPNPAVRSMMKSVDTPPDSNNTSSKKLAILELESSEKKEKAQNQEEPTGDGAAVLDEISKNGSQSVHRKSL